LSYGVKPKQSDNFSAESEYAIEDPLTNYWGLKFSNNMAFSLFSEMTRNVQDGNNAKAQILHNQALRINPSLHEDAREILSKMIDDGTVSDEGAIYYWLGIHSEYLMEYKQAALWYEKAAKVYNKTGYPVQESRVYCNLGSVKMRMNDPTGMDDFEKAIALNPRDGTAHLNVARLYYGISDPGDDRYERALDAFADAIVSDPQRYGPKVISSLREIGYTWKEDLEEITRRVEKKQRIKGLNKN
jgi:tetratricopeptide (TPR) repeat protein